MKYKIFELVGENCVTLEDGEKIYGIIYPELKVGNSVELDFNEVRIFASPFFNSAIGRLLKDIEPQSLNTQLKFSSLSQVGKNILRQVISNSVKYYQDQKHRKAHDEVMKEMAEVN